MTRDPPPPAADDADGELSSLFATLKDDAAPPDLEARLLSGLATTAAASAGAAAANVGLGHKIALWLGTSGLGKSMIVGALCGGAVCGAIAVVESPPGSAPPAGEISPPPERPPLSATGTPLSNKPYSNEAVPPSPGAPAPSAAPVRDGDARTPTPASAPAAQPSAGVTGGEPEPAPAPPAGPEAALSATAAPAPSPSPSVSGASDELRRELLHVRGISALVDAGRCAEARAAIAAYRSEHRTGQLAGEVDVLAARCQGR